MPGRRQWWLLRSLLVVAALFSAAACGPLDGGTDTDDEAVKAKGLLAGAPEVSDSLDVDAGDTVDWRVFEHFEKADVKITYRVGDPVKRHEIKGVIRLFDSTYKELAQKLVEPGVAGYEITFTAEPGNKYFLAFSASEGASGYHIDVAATPADPCTLCTPDEMCEEGRCVPRRRECDPPCEVGFECNEDRGRCEEIECEEGEYFDKEEEECKPDVCAKKRCPRGQRCKERRGRAYCYAAEAAPPRDCKPACGAGQVCRAGKCVDAAAPGPKCPAECPKGQSCDEKTGKCVGTSISGKILNFWPEGKSTIMLLNKGSEHGIKKGMGGSIGGGGSFTVIEVYPYQCRAKTALSKDEMVGKKSVTFK